MAGRHYIRARDSVPLSQFGVLVAQLESIAVSAAQQQPDSLLCFDLLSDLISAIDEDPKDSIMLWQRKCEDALHSLLALGLRGPVRHLVSTAMARVIIKGDPISIYSRVSSLQGFLSDAKRGEPQKVAGAAQCLGELYRFFGRKITSGLPETASSASKLMKYHEEYVRKEALHMLQNALEGCGGTSNSVMYTEAFRLIVRSGVSDKSFIVRKAAARCLKAFANIGGPGLGVVELEHSASTCVKGLDDPVLSVRDAFADALGAVLALGMNPEAQVEPRGKGQVAPMKRHEGCLQKYLVIPFVKALGSRSRGLRVGLTLSWVSFLQATRHKYLHPDNELQDYAVQIMNMLQPDTSVDAQALACVLYILRVGVTDLMTEPTQRSFLVVLGKQLQTLNASPAMNVAALRTLSYTLKTLGEVPFELKDILDDTVVAALSHSSQLVRVEAALTLKALAEVDPICVGGLISYGITTLKALKENVAFEKGMNLRTELDSLHGQASLLSALVSVSPKLPLGYPSGLPKSVLEVSKKMLLEYSRKSSAAIIEKEAGWLLLSSILASMPKEELEEQVFDILTLWAPVFCGNAELEVGQAEDLTLKICVWSSSIDALTAFIRCFITPVSLNNGILLQPVLVYLSRALSYISCLSTKRLPNIKPAMDVFIIRTLMAFQALPDPTAYKSDHSQIIQICTAPFRTPSLCEESSCLRSLLDKRDAWLGPWTPGRDWLEDELRAFQGGKDGLMPCVWDPDLPSFPQPETISKMLVNQMLLCFGTLFAFQDSKGMHSLLGKIGQCIKSGRKQLWHSSSVTNICVGLLAALKALLTFRPEPLGPDILNMLQTIFQGVLAEGDICASQRRAASEGLGYLTRLGNDAFTARLMRSLLSDLTGTTDSYFAGSIALALGCIHHSAGGMALSSLVPVTVSSISSLAKTSAATSQIWYLHGLLLTIEAAGLSYITHVQATLSLSLEILLAEENGWIELHQGVGRLINAVVAVLGPELSPGSIFFSRCKSVIAEISSSQETATLLESVRFTQQLALFAPQALSVHSHVQTLVPTLSSRQPALRHLAISTLRHLIEKDPVSVVNEQLEDNLFHMMDEETDPEILNLIRNTIMRLLYASCPSCPSHWISVCRKMVLAVPTTDSGSSEIDPGDEQLNQGNDEDNMVSRSNPTPKQDFVLESSRANLRRDKHLRYRTKVYAAECLSHITTAVGNNSAHFDLNLARIELGKAHAAKDWLIFQLQELISLAYQISTIQFEKMQPIGIGLLSTVIDKFETVSDPELPGRLLLEQYQAQFLSTLRSALDVSAGPVLLEAGLQLATKILTSGIISGDQVAVKRIFSLISSPLGDFKGLYYPSFAEWVSCKIKVRLLAAHASLKCHFYAFLRRQASSVPDEPMALLPLFSKTSDVLGKCWLWTLKDLCHMCFNLNSRKNWKPFLDGIKSPLISSKLKLCLIEAWPMILQALVLDAAPIDGNVVMSTQQPEVRVLGKDFISGYSMVQLESEDFRFLWGLALLIIFQGETPAFDKQIVLKASAKAGHGDSPVKETKPPGLPVHEIALPVFQNLCTERFFKAGFLSLDLCRELVQVLTYLGCKGGTCDTLVVTVLAQIVQNCPEEYLDSEALRDLITELCLAYLFKISQSADAAPIDGPTCTGLSSQLLITSRILLTRLEHKKQIKSFLAFILIAYRCINEASSELMFSKINEFVQCTDGYLIALVEGATNHDTNTILQLQMMIQAGEKTAAMLARDCIEAVHLLKNRKSNMSRLVHSKLAFSLEQTIFFARLIYKVEIVQHGKCTNSMNMAVFSDCIRCISLLLSDSCSQVQAIGLQVLKTTLHKKVASKDDSFLVILTCELFRDILVAIQKILKGPLAGESTALAGECLKTLLLMLTLPMGIECQKVLMSLLLEVIVMVLLTTEGAFSQESHEIRNVAIKLVSTLTQIPSTAVHFREILLDMPETHRLQIQGVIRASVTQEQNLTATKSSGPTLEIKLPLPSETTKAEISTSPTLQLTSQTEDEEDEDEDDWDAFQSFPASVDQADKDSKMIPASEQCSVEDPSVSKSNVQHDDESEDLSSDHPLKNREEGNSNDGKAAARPGSASDGHNEVEIDTSETKHLSSGQTWDEDDSSLLNLDQSTVEVATVLAEVHPRVGPEEKDKQGLEEDRESGGGEVDYHDGNVALEDESSQCEKIGEFDRISRELEANTSLEHSLSTATVDGDQMISEGGYISVQVGETSNSVDLPDDQDGEGIAKQYGRVPEQASEQVLNDCKDVGDEEGFSKGREAQKSKQ